VKTDCDLHNNLQRYLSFQFIFTFVTDFECFNWPAIQEGVVCSWYMYGTYFRGDQVLELGRNRLL